MDEQVIGQRVAGVQLQSSIEEALSMLSGLFHGTIWQVVLPRVEV